MGVLSDQLFDLIEKMKESDKKMKQLTDHHIASVNQFIEKTECIESEFDPFADAIELLQSHGYQVIPPTK